MAPDPVWAETASADGEQRGSCAAGIAAVEPGVVAGVVGAGPTDDRRADADAVVATVRAGDAAVDGRTEAAVVVAADGLVTTVVTSEPVEVVGPAPCSAADLLVPQALTKTATTPTVAIATPHRRDEGEASTSQVARGPTGIS